MDNLHSSTRLVCLYCRVPDARPKDGICRVRKLVTCTVQGTHPGNHSDRTTKGLAEPIRGTSKAAMRPQDRGWCDNHTASLEGDATQAVRSGVARVGQRCMFLASLFTEFLELATTQGVSLPDLILKKIRRAHHGQPLPNFCLVGKSPHHPESLYDLRGFSQVWLTHWARSRAQRPEKTHALLVSCLRQPLRYPGGELPPRSRPAVRLPPLGVSPSDSPWSPPRRDLILENRSTAYDST